MVRGLTARFRPETEWSGAPHGALLDNTNLSASRPKVLLWMPEGDDHRRSMAKLRSCPSLSKSTGVGTVLISDIMNFGTNFAAPTSDQGLGFKCRVCGLRGS